jgi:hypothetical protein
MSNQIREAYNRLFQYMSHRNFAGYDPYDGNSTSRKFLKQYYPLRVIMTYLNKFSPVNLRPVLGIRRSESNQTMAFIVRAMLTHTPDGLKTDVYIRERMEHFLKTSHNAISGEHAWHGLDFPVQMIKPRTPFNHTIPDSISIEACALAIVQYAKKYRQQEKYKEYITGAAKYLLSHHLVQSDNITFFKYYPVSRPHTVTYNASIIAAAFLLEANRYENNPVWDIIATKSMEFVIDNQHEAGFWNYGINLENGYEKPQVDFHQGFVLDALLVHMHLHGFKDHFLISYKKGLSFYHRKQFLPTGQGIYRYPRKWPVNIHNQAQGIITFTRAAKAGFGDHYLDFARTIAEWTIKHMQDPDGHFYYLKYPWFTNKIPYIRWSDAAMAYALAVYLDYDKTR